MEMRRFGKPTTVVEGLKMSERDLHELARKMKKGLAAGGTVKDGINLLQGDHRENAAKILVESGFPQGSIEIPWIKGLRGNLPNRGNEERNARNIRVCFRLSVS